MESIFLTFSSIVFSPITLEMLGIIFLPVTLVFLIYFFLRKKFSLNKQYFSELLFIGTSISSTISIAFAICIYLSLYSWWIVYEPCGIQFVAIPLYIMPELIIIGLINISFCKWNKISNYALFFPAISGVLLILPFYDTSLSDTSRFIGSCIAFSLLLLMLVISFFEIRKLSLWNVFNKI